MRKIVIAGAIALAAVVLLPQFSLTVRAADLGVQAGGADRLAAVNIGRVKRILRLTPKQEPYWQPVEAALRDLVRRQARADGGGFVHRISQHVVSIVLNSAAIERLAVVARPLIGVLDDEQKQAAGALAQEMGLGPVVAALN
jgi:hypothetical protein